jgi:flagellar basal body P-ring formation protein FlgA
LRPIAFTLTGLLALARAGHATPPLENLDLLDARIAVYLGGTASDAGRRAQPVDRRLRLMRCGEGVLLDPPALGAIAAYCPSRGWRVHVPLIGGAATEPAEIIVRRGDAVRLAYLGTGFDVSTTAIALEDGRNGGMVRVKVPTGASVLTARVRGPGSVAIGD